MFPSTAPLHEQFLPPPPSLRPMVQHLLLLTVDARASPVMRTLLPTFQVLMLFNLGPAGIVLWPLPGPAGDEPLPASLPLTTTLLAGPLKSGWHYRLPAGARVLVVTFTLGGFYRLFRIPADALPLGFADPAGLLFPTGLASLWARLNAAAAPVQLRQIFADFCQPYLRPVDPAQQSLLTHLPVLTRPGNLNPVQLMAAVDQVSERTLQLRFRKYLGFSAKEALRFRRFRHLLAVLPTYAATGHPIDWQALLERFGYYDQSHLIHDFSYFLRQSPTQAARQLRAGDQLCLAHTQFLSGPSFTHKE